ncbi:MAG: adenine phosphoribosyltransferase [Bacteroidota bacterium]|mgnify:FL=1
MNIVDKVKSKIRDVKDFPKPGIIFKDVTPLLSDPQLCVEIVNALANHWQHMRVDAVVGIESRGFLFGMLLAQSMEVPFIPVRKQGKLPWNTISHSYALEYGEATVEVHTDSIDPNWNVLVHDDLLATGGTADAAAELIKKLKGTVAGFSFLVELEFLEGKTKLNEHNTEIRSLIYY